jgi:hypothetical protein
MYRVLLLAVGLLTAPLLAAADDAVILDQSGTVTIELAASGRPEPAITGQPLQPGDVVNTGTDGTVIILLSDGSRVDLFPNSRLQIRDRDAAANGGGGFLGRLWRSITGKFSDSEYASAQAGGVGAFRASVAEEEMFNDYASEIDLAEISALLAAVAAEGLPESTAELMKAIVYEDYGQFIRAEVIYLERLSAFPDDPVIYDMLFDMYLKMDFYGHAAAIIEMKSARLSAEASE